MSSDFDVSDDLLLAERDIRVTLGALLRKCRKERRLTMIKLAQSAHCSQSFLSKVENGGLLPSLPMLYRIARALGVTPGYLLGEELADRG